MDDAFSAPWRTDAIACSRSCASLIWSRMGPVRDMRRGAMTAVHVSVLCQKSYGFLPTQRKTANSDPWARTTHCEWFKGGSPALAGIGHSACRAQLGDETPAPPPSLRARTVLHRWGERGGGAHVVHIHVYMESQMSSVSS